MESENKHYLSSTPRGELVRGIEKRTFISYVYKIANLWNTFECSESPTEFSESESKKKNNVHLLYRDVDGEGKHSAKLTVEEQSKRREGTGNGRGGLNQQTDLLQSQFL